MTYKHNNVKMADNSDDIVQGTAMFAVHWELHPSIWSQRLSLC